MCFLKLKKVHLLVNELYIYQNARCNDKKRKHLCIRMWDRIPWNRGSAIANYRSFSRVGKCGQTLRPEAVELIFVTFFGITQTAFYTSNCTSIVFWKYYTNA